MNVRHAHLLSLLLATAVAGESSLQEAGQSTTAPPTIMEYWDPVFGYEDENGNIIEVSSLPPDIAAQQANTPVQEVDATEEVHTQDIASESTTQEPPLIVEDYYPIFGYTDENGNIVEVNELPADIAEEQANTPVGEVDTPVGATTEEPPLVVEDYEPVYGYRDENGNIVEVDELPADIAEEQANTPVYEEPSQESPVAETPVEDYPVEETPVEAMEGGSRINVTLISLLSGAAFVLVLGGVFLYCHFHQQSQELNDLPSFDGKAKAPERLEATENSESGSCETENDDDSDGPIVRAVASGSNDAPKSAELARAIASMRQKEQEALDEVYAQEGLFVI